MIRGISTKWTLGVLLSLALPLLGFAWYARTQVIAQRAENVMQSYLIGTTADLAGLLQAELRERRQDLAIMASIPAVRLFATGGEIDQQVFGEWVPGLFNDQVELSRVYDRILALDHDGSVMGWNTKVGDHELTDDDILSIESQFFGDEEWFRRCMQTGDAVIDFHHSEFAPETGPGSHVFHVGFAHRIEPMPQSEESEEGLLEEQQPGVVVAFVDWRHIQRLVDRYGVRRLGSQRRGKPLDLYQSSYAWIWGEDADTILAHNERSLSQQRVSELEGGALLPLVQAAQSGEIFGMYPPYEFKGEQKKAAYFRLDGSQGVRWVVGVGVEATDIYTPVKRADRLLLLVGLLSLLSAGCLAYWVARRMTRPVLALKEQADRVAAGDLDARVTVRGHDEVADLSHSFNNMAHDLAESRAKVIKAEKEAAWREMALQVAHEIKNPLTPIRLSVDLLRRTWVERREEFEPVLHSTTDMIQRQVENMREVTRDFSDFAGTHKPAMHVLAGPMLAETLQWTEAYSLDLGVKVHTSGLDSDAWVFVNQSEMQRALLNLLNNALEAMPDGGELFASVRVDGEWVEFEIRDTGPGISEEARAHLFEPHFTTRSSGTGLGLAIARRVVESRGGTLDLSNTNGTASGAVAIMRLPFVRPSSASSGENSGSADAGE